MYKEVIYWADTVNKGPNDGKLLAKFTATARCDECGECDEKEHEESCEQYFTER